MIKLKVDRSVKKSLEEYIEDEMTKIVSDLGSKIYNQIILDESNSPYWSGAYITSWNLNSGSPDTSYSDPDSAPRGSNSRYPAQGHFGEPAIITNFKAAPYEIVYITNYAPHAAMVEFDGTKSHPDPWMTAHHGVNTVMGLYNTLS